MKKKIISELLILLVFTVSSSLGLEKKTSLSFKSVFFSAQAEFSIPSKDTISPEILILAQIAGTDQEKDAPDQANALKKIFNLETLSVVHESKETELSWESWKEKKKDHPQVSQTLAINGEEYRVILIPEEIIFGERLFDVQFHLEIRKIPNSKDPVDLKTSELVCAKDILWNFKGPLTIGFFSDKSISFLTITIEASVAHYGPRLGGGIIWIL